MVMREVLVILEVFEAVNAYMLNYIVSCNLSRR
jgi:hypothetical protein